MTNIVKTPKKANSVAFDKSDAHLKSLQKYITHTEQDEVIVNGYVVFSYENEKDYAVFYAVELNKWLTQDYDEATDLKEIFCEYENQYSECDIYNYHKGFIEDTKTSEITPYDDAFDGVEALKDAEYRAYEYLINL